MLPISSWKLWILGVRFKGQPSAMWLFKKLCRIDGIEKRKEKKKRKIKKKGTVK